jgi:catechol 2,3-dioxygenase-like lactoylglutathione lyase family enzyme
MSSNPCFAYLAPVFRVADLPRSLEFYRDRLGFDLEFEHQGFYAGVVRDRCRIHLKCAPPPQRDHAAFTQAEHLDACIAVNDAPALAGEMASRGAPFSVPLRQMPYGREFFVRDPDGYVLGFVEPAEG